MIIVIHHVDPFISSRSTPSLPVTSVVLTEVVVVVESSLIAHPAWNEVAVGVVVVTTASVGWWTIVAVCSHMPSPAACVADAA